LKAAVYYGPGKIKVEERPKPTLKEDEVLIQVKACAICGTDVRIYTYGQANVKPPHIIGHEITGVISEMGEGVTGYKGGERVTLVTCVGCGRCEFCLAGRVNLCPQMRAIGYHYSGGFAEWMIVPAEAVYQSNILLLPDNLSFEEATLAEPLSCCINGEEYLDIKAGDTVTIIGAGPIGCMHAQLAEVSGATKVILADISEERLELARGVKADVYINSQKENLVDRVLEETQGAGSEVVITACPSPEAQEQALAITRSRGRISFFGGLPHDKSKIPFESNIIHYKEISVFGAYASHHLQYKSALKLLSSQRIEGEKLITHRFPLEEIEKAIQVVKKGKALKAIITME